MKQLMPYEKFKAIMTILVDFKEQRDRISDFFEKELMQDSWCIITLGSNIESALMGLLADEFECWYSFQEKYEFMIGGILLKSTGDLRMI